MKKKKGKREGNEEKDEGTEENILCGLKWKRKKGNRNQNSLDHCRDFSRMIYNRQKYDGRLRRKKQIFIVSTKKREFINSKDY